MQAVGKKLESDLADLKSRLKTQEMETRKANAKFVSSIAAQEKLKAEKAEPDAKAKVLTDDRAAFKLLEEKARTPLKSLYKKGLEEPLVVDNEGPNQLVPYLVGVLEDVVSGIGPMAEEEACVLSLAALTRIFSHLHLRNPTAHLDKLLEPVKDEHYEAAAAAMKGQVEALLKRFCAFTPAPPTGGATDSATPAGGAGKGDAAEEEASLAGDSGVQG